MNETTVRGNIITDPYVRRVNDDPVFSFRVASNSRYQDRDSGEWKNGSTLYFTASCWGHLAEKVGGRLVKGDAVIVSGRLQTNEYEWEGTVRRDLEMRVTGIGPDMARMEVTARRLKSEQVTSGGPERTADACESPNVLGSIEESETGDSDDDRNARANDDDDGDARIGAAVASSDRFVGADRG